MIILEENFKWHLEAFASELFVCLWAYTWNELCLYHWIIFLYCKSTRNNLY